MKLAQELGREALDKGISILGLAKIHEKVLATHFLPVCPAGQRVAITEWAEVFFTATITPVELTESSLNKAAVRFKNIIAKLKLRTAQVATTNRQLGREVARHKATAETLQKSQLHNAQSLKTAETMKVRLQQLSRQILSVQEEERKRISRELHDVIAQMFTGINVRLANLKREAALNTNGLVRNIAHTQRLVAKSAKIVHEFARELRPAALDDLGLIPALQSFINLFTAKTRILSSLTAYPGVKQLNAARRTVLFRVAQEALTNVARHAKAKQVDVSIHKLSGFIGMTIKDDGQSFKMDDIMFARGRKHLGLLGMRERVEMVGGRFELESSPGKGTTITVLMPVGKTAAADGGTVDTKLEIL